MRYKTSWFIVMRTQSFRPIRRADLSALARIRWCHVQAPIHIPVRGVMPPFDVYDAYEAAAKAEQIRRATFDDAIAPSSTGRMALKRFPRRGAVVGSLR